MAKKLVEHVLTEEELELIESGEDKGIDGKVEVLKRLKKGEYLWVGNALRSRDGSEDKLNAYLEKIREKGLDIGKGKGSEYGFKIKKSSKRWVDLIIYKR